MEKRLPQALLKCEAYPEPTRTVSLVQTHVSFLFITDDYVYKIKKPVDLGFLNFTTLDRRRFYCEEEVRLNRRLCPDLYLGVVPVREAASGVTLRGDGGIVDYAVKMRRLPEERMLARLLEEGMVTGEEIREIARTIAAFHGRAERGREIDLHGGIDGVRRNWEENFRQVAGLVGGVIGARDLEAIRGWVERFLAEREGLFNDRVAGGFIRDCDGDIHAENICLAERIQIFDCIEFNERFRHIDTAADIAFLLMDLDYHARGDLSRILLDEYTAASGDASLTGVVDFYKVYRAFVRGKVEGFRLADPRIPREERLAAEARAARHFRLARGYILRLGLPPSLIILSGLMGSGKSTLARELAMELGLDLARSDVVRKEIAGVPPLERRLDAYGAGIYGDDLTRSVYGRLLEAAEGALTEGRGAVMDASFRRREDRAAFRALADRHGAPFLIIETRCPEEEAERRLKARATARDEVSDGRWELYQRQRAEFEGIGEDEGSTLSLDTRGPLGENMDAVLHFLGLR